MPAPRLLAPVIEEGTPSSYTQVQLTDGVKRWSTNIWAGHLVRLLGGTNDNSVVVVRSNDARSLVFASLLENAPEPTLETRYEILGAFLPSSGELTVAEQQVALLEDLKVLLEQIRFGLSKLADVDLTEA